MHLSLTSFFSRSNFEGRLPMAMEGTFLDISGFWHFQIPGSFIAFDGASAPVEDFRGECKVKKAKR